jgi:hypothetical protein
MCVVLRGKCCAATKGARFVVSGVEVLLGHRGKKKLLLAAEVVG